VAIKDNDATKEANVLTIMSIIPKSLEPSCMIFLMSSLEKGGLVGVGVDVVGVGVGGCVGGCVGALVGGAVAGVIDGRRGDFVGMVGGWIGDWVGGAVAGGLVGRLGGIVGVGFCVAGGLTSGWHRHMLSFVLSYDPYSRIVSISSCSLRKSVTRCSAKPINGESFIGFSFRSLLIVVVGSRKVNGATGDGVVSAGRKHRGDRFRPLKTCWKMSSAFSKAISSSKATDRKMVSSSYPSVIGPSQSVRASL
jgi:hypothetical protein